MKRFQADIILFIATVFWASSFVAQRLGAGHIGAFTFNACRYGVGGFVIYSVARVIARRRGGRDGSSDAGWAGYVLGVLLFLGAMCQQIGLATTTAGKAGFLTTCYVVVMPLLSTLLGHRLRLHEVCGGVLAFCGTYFLSVEENFTVTSGDLWEIFGALWWALHIIAVSYYSVRADKLRLCYQQTFVCAFLSFLCAPFFETWDSTEVLAAAPAFIYAGVFSVAFSSICQITTQHRVSPSRASIIYSAEALMAAGFGWLLIGETFNERMVFGAALVVAGVLLAQYTAEEAPPLLMEG